jgi:hypothetical protein
MHPSTLARIVAIAVVVGCALTIQYAYGQPSRPKENYPMIPEHVSISLRENGFDCCWNLQPRDIAVRMDSRSQLKGLIDDAESFVSKVFTSEWLPESRKGYLVPIKGGGREPDRLVYRYKVEGNKIDVEMVYGEFSVTLNVAFPEPKPVKASEEALEIYRKWNRLVLRSEGGTTSQIEAMRVEGYWIVYQVFEKSVNSGERPQKRYTPWTWSESVRMAIDSQGKWLAISVNRLPDRVDTLPKGRAGRSQGSWFDSYIQ